MVWIFIAKDYDTSKIDLNDVYCSAPLHKDPRK